MSARIAFGQQELPERLGTVDATGQTAAQPADSYRLPILQFVRVAIKMAIAVNVTITVDITIAVGVVGRGGLGMKPVQR